MQTAFKITDHKDASKNIQDEITLSYEERFIRRKKLTTDNGTEFLVNL
jgi:urease accessory protein UreE